MKLFRAVKASAALEELMEEKLPYQTAYLLLKRKRELETAVRLFEQEEWKLVNQYAQKDECGQIDWVKPGVFRFASEKDQQEYAQRMDELREMEIEENHEPIIMEPPEQISANTLEALEGMVEFQGESE